MAQQLQAEIARPQSNIGSNRFEFNAQLAAADAIIAAMNTNTAKQQDAQQARSDLNTSIGTNVPLIRFIAQKVKKNSHYTNGIGEDLGIVGDEQSIDVPNSKPQLKAKKVDTGWSLSFNLKGFFDSVKIYRTRPGGIKTFIAIDTASPYIDTEAQVNGTIYTAYYMLADTAVGIESDALSVTV